MPLDRKRCRFVYDLASGKLASITHTPTGIVVTGADEALMLNVLERQVEAYERSRSMFNRFFGWIRP